MVTDLGAIAAYAWACIVRDVELIATVYLRLRKSARCRLNFSCKKR